MYRYVTIQELATLLKNGKIEAESQFGHSSDPDNGWNGDTKAIFVWLYQGNDHWEYLSQWFFQYCLYGDRVKIKFKDSLKLVGEGWGVYHKYDQFNGDRRVDHYREGYVKAYSLADVLPEFNRENVEEVMEYFFYKSPDSGFPREDWDWLIREDLELSNGEVFQVFDFLLSYAK